MPVVPPAGLSYFSEGLGVGEACLFSVQCMKYFNTSCLKLQSKPLGYIL